MAVPVSQTVAGAPGDLLSRRGRSVTSSIIRDLLHLTTRPDVLSMAGGLPAPESFPVDRLRLAADTVLSGSGRYGPEAIQYGPTEGVPALRQWVAETYQARGGECHAEDVLITTGSQQGLDLLARALIDPGDQVVVEAPSYVGALQALAGSDPHLVPIPADRDGLRTDLLEEGLAGGLRPRLCYVVANFQNPSGATLALDRRRHLAALADRYGFVIVEDDPYGALRFRGSPLPPVRSFTNLAVTLGTVSKLLAPGLRVGWLAAPTWLHGPLVRLKQAADLHTSTLCQRMAFDVLSDDAFMPDHLARLGPFYGDRCDALAAALERSLGGQAAFDLPDGGMFLWVRLTDATISARDLLPRAIAAGVAFVPGEAFHVDGSGDDHLRLSFATLRPEELAEAAGRLATALA
ncbi:MAG TPA: PLP-dependent aminotransferase family protein [Acidimicrobiales bacterium]